MSYHITVALTAFGISRVNKEFDFNAAIGLLNSRTSVPFNPYSALMELLIGYVLGCPTFSTPRCTGGCDKKCMNLTSEDGKAVGTLHSGIDGDIFMCIWGLMSPEQQKMEGKPLHVYVHEPRDDGSTTVNPIVVYSEVRVNALAIVTGKTRDEILKLCATNQEGKPGSIELDIVRIAFANLDSILTATGRELKRRYLTALSP
jgi:hypothetical protein